MGALLFAIVVFSMRLVAPNFFLEAAAPLLRASGALGLASHTFFAEFSNSAALAARNEELLAQNNALSIENATLSQKLGGIGSAPISGILVDIAARPPVSPYDTLVLGKGEKDGIVIHMEAFAPNGAPIGVVSSVLDGFSQVTLFSAPGVETHGWVGGTALPVTLTGAGAGVVTASVSRAAQVAVGDRVFAPGPGQLAIGTVERVESTALSPSITLRIALATNIFSLSSVEVRSTGITGMAFSTSTLP